MVTITKRDIKPAGPIVASALQQTMRPEITGEHRRRGDGAARQQNGGLTRQWLD